MTYIGDVGVVYIKSNVKLRFNQSVQYLWTFDIIYPTSIFFFNFLDLMTTDCMHRNGNVKEASKIKDHMKIINLQENIYSISINIDSKIKQYI